MTQTQKTKSTKKPKQPKKPKQSPDPAFNANTHVTSRDVMKHVRTAWIEGVLVPMCSKVFAERAQLEYATFAVAQYWDDEAHDATHSEVAFWRAKPRLDLYKQAVEEDYDNKIPPAEKLRLEMLGERAVEANHHHHYRDQDFAWHDNVMAVTIWSAYANETNQEDRDFHPALLINRSGAYEWLTDIVHKHKDGIKCNWGKEDDGIVGCVPGGGIDTMIKPITITKTFAEKLRALDVRVEKFCGGLIPEGWVARLLAEKHFNEGEILVALQDPAAREAMRTFSFLARAR